MRSSSGLYFSRLDHIRAAAAFLVYFWHFVHVHVPFETVPTIFFLSVLEEGHAGVALFMTLSGYLFAKITDGRAIVLSRFYWNRFIRLAPLLCIVLAYWAVRGRLSVEDFIVGFIKPSWPGGTWSIVVEIHFYALFPLILGMQRHRPISALAGLLILTTAVRTLVWALNGSVQDLAYWTIGGCIDMFLAGMLWHQLAKFPMIRRNATTILIGSILAFAAFWHVFNLAGGFYGMGGMPSPSPLWIIIPAVSGLSFGAIIVGYEAAPITIPKLLDRCLAKIGEASYSLYLLHFIFFTALAKSIAALGLPLARFDVGAIAAIATFPLAALIAIISYELIEKPCLRLRSGYHPTSASTPSTNHNSSLGPALSDPSGPRATTNS
ncbi:MAG TPA: acyltransferase [Hyphomicrobiaceae bacterium]|nr:acyltransferase [Hyphomicrobiaceae bacterium]